MSVATGLPPHTVEAVRDLARKQVPMQRIAFMTNLSLQAVLEVIAVAGTDQEFAVAAEGLKDHRPLKLKLRGNRYVKISGPAMKVATKRLMRWKKKAARTKSSSRGKASA